MTRRTRGLRDFSFERCCYSTDKLSVVITVSGWMQKNDDDKRTYGVLPSDQYMTLEERLTRFYTRILLQESIDSTVRLSCEQRLKRVKKDALEWSKKSNDIVDSYFDELKIIFGFDPRLPENLVAPPRNPNMAAESEHLLHLAVAELYFKITPNQALTSIDATNLGMTTIDLSSPYRKLKFEADDVHESRDCLEGSASASHKSERANSCEEEVLRGLHWDWAELEESAAYELYLLRWERVK